MTVLTKHFNARDYFDKRNAQSGTVLEFRYIQGLITRSGAKVTITPMIYQRLIDKDERPIVINSKII